MPVILCIIYSATIFGAKKATLPYLGRDIYKLIEEFTEDLYKKTDHIKPYSSFLRKRLVYYSRYGNYGGPSDGMFEITDQAWRDLGNIVGAGTMFLMMTMTILKDKRPDFFRANANLMNKLFGAIGIGGIGSMLAILVFDVITSVSREYRTYIESFPLNISVESNQDSFCVNGSSPVSHLPGGNYYRTECRSLSNMNLKWRRLDQVTPSKIGDIKLKNNKSRKKNGWFYRLENGEVNIYKSKLDLQKGNKLSSLPTTEKVTAFDVSEDGKIIVTGGKDGIRKWELLKTKKLETILEEE